MAELQMSGSPAASMHEDLAGADQLAQLVAVIGGGDEQQGPDGSLRALRNAR